ncbi:MAG: 5-formyltetrahydrofolate cyclo-ligase [Methyloprofundus sp.]|nr:5-formyltetrahydrofolate cyclo-ligase [Methyloprofundus sp.]
MLQPKDSQRRAAYDARNAQANKEKLSQIICASVLEHDVYQQAHTVLWYLHCRSEVCTYQTVQAEILQQDKKIVIPYCTKDAQGNNQLGLWHVQDLAELVAGTWGILEPPKVRWGELGREIPPESLDFIVTPGVAFDKSGGRLGNGAGYYDRLLASIRKNTFLLGVGFDCQLIEQVCMQDYDIYMDAVVSESAIYQGKCRLI